jgi:bacillithiol system protein YtxJ
MRPAHPLASAADLDTAVAASEAGPVILFKHSLTCGTSGMAAEEVRAFADTAPDVPIYQLAVQRQRDVSALIERRFGIRHETPQVIVLRHGAVAWHGSHFRVTAAALDAAVGALVAR